MTKVICKCLAALLLLAAVLPCSAQTSTTYKYFRVGNAADVQVKPQAGYALMGGGEDLDDAFKWLCEKAHGGDLLVLRATGTDAYNDYIQKLCHLNSVATVVIPDREAAKDPFVEKKIRSASAIFISGGDQANYINFWQGTRVQIAMNDAIARGIPMGGTSAGLAILGEYAYSAQGDKPNDHDLDTKLAMSDPYGPRITLVQGFLNIPLLKGIITDTHFARRDRMGRLLVFLARLAEPEGKPLPPPGKQIRGIGVEQGVALLLEPDGHATVTGRGSVYLIDPQGASGVLSSHTPLSFGPFKVQKVESGHTLDLKSWTGTSITYSFTVRDGIIASTQAGGAIY